MKRELLEHLRCPACVTRLSLAVREDDRSQVKTGELTCAAKLHTFQVSRFVPRFVDAGTGRGV